MGTSVVNPAAESAAAEPNFAIETFTPEQYTAWETKGTIPDAKPAADSSDAATTTDNAGASPEDEPAADSAPAQSQEPPKGKRGAEARIQQLLRERNELQAKLAGYEKPSDVKPAAESSTAATKPAADELKRPTRPIWGEVEGEKYADFEARQDEYTAALAKYEAKVLLKETREQETRRAEEAKREEAANAANAAFHERLGKARAELPDLDTLLETNGPNTPISPVMDGFIRGREYGPKLLHHFLTHPEEAANIAAMSQFDAAEAIADLARPWKGSAAAAEPQGTPAKPITRAARPATDIRATSAAPADPIRAAVEADDFTRFEQERNRADVERRRRG